MTRCVTRASWITSATAVCWLLWTGSGCGRASDTLVAVVAGQEVRQHQAQGSLEDLSWRYEVQYGHRPRLPAETDPRQMVLERMRSRLRLKIQSILWRKLLQEFHVQVTAADQLREVRAMQKSTPWYLQQIARDFGRQSQLLYRGVQAVQHGQDPHQVYLRLLRKQYFEEGMWRTTLRYYLQPAHLAELRYQATQPEKCLQEVMRNTAHSRVQLKVLQAAVDLQLAARDSSVNHALAALRVQPRDAEAQRVLENARQAWWSSYRQAHVRILRPDLMAVLNQVRMAPAPGWK